MSSENHPSKIGAGHASAMFRQGLAELRAALYPDSNVAQPTQYGTRTPGEVMQERAPDARDPDEQPYSAVERRLPALEPHDEPGQRDGREPDRE